MAFQSLAQVVGADGQLLGSAFFICPRHLLTAAHVVGEQGAVAALRTGGREYHFITVLRQLPRRRNAVSELWDAPDLAWLRVDDRELAAHPSALLSDRVPSGPVLA